MIAPTPWTPTLRVEDALPQDTPDIARLLRRCAPETIAVPEAEIRRRWNRYLVVRAEGIGVVATAAVHVLDAGRCELRSLAVDPRWRGHGLGARLVRGVVRRARGRHVVCVTIRPAFFERLGFRPVPLDAAPERPDRSDRVAGRTRVAMEWSPAPAAALSPLVPVPSP
jgi:amino-acid N-acetyltransferase